MKTVKLHLNKISDLFFQSQTKLPFIMYFAFVFLNTLKLALLETVMLGDVATLKVFVYKFFVNLIYSSVLMLFMLPKKRGYFIAAYVLQTIYLFANISYYLYFCAYLHVVQWFVLMAEGFSLATNLMIPIGWSMLFIILDLPIFIYFAVNYKRGRIVVKQAKIFSIVISAVSVMSFVFTQPYGLLKLDKIDDNIADSISSETEVMEYYGILGNDIHFTLTNGSDEQYISKLSYGKELSAEKTKDKQPNIVVIQVESLDASGVGLKYNGEYVMPYLTELGNNSVYYPYTLSYHMGGATSDCEFSSYNSIEPIAGFPAIKLKNYGFENSYVKRLVAGGYNAIAFHGNDKEFFTRGEVYPSIGYRAFFDLHDFGLKEQGWGASDGDLFDAVLKQIKTEKEPFFSYVITMTSHEPFRNVYHYYENPDYENINSAEVRNYLNSLNYVDAQLEKFVTEIKNEFDDVNIVILGDHTASVEDDEYTSSAFKYNNMLFEFVPLFIITEDNKVYKEEERVATFIDVAPTILNISGVKYNILSNGSDLLKPETLSENVTLKGEVFTRAELYEMIAEIELGKKY